MISCRWLVCIGSGSAVFLLGWCVGVGRAAGPVLPTTRVAVPGSTFEFEMVRLPPGIWQGPSGQDRPAAQRVEIRSIWMACTELSWQAYDAWLLAADLTEQQRAAGVLTDTRPSSPYHVYDFGFGHSGFAAVGIHPHAAEEYCRWLTLTTGKRFRLPGEAEWEYACRGGSDTEPFKDERDLMRMAWVRENSLNDLEEPVAHPTGKKRPNSWGLHDMLGNAAEWVVGYDGLMVVKGGSFQDRASRVSSRARMRFDPRWQLSDPCEPKSRWWLRDGPHIGFRIVCEE